jgi:cytoskeletal protein CcmA (bactofilin family)
MRFRSEVVLAASILGAVLLLPSLPAMAAETSNSEFVIIPEGDVFPEDLYAGAIRVVVDGTLEGDLIAFAAEEIVINGVVTGSVTAIAPTITIAGEVGGSVRGAANRLEVSGEIGGDLVAAVFRAELTPSSTVDGDVLLWAWNARVLGSIRMDLTGSQRHLELAGSVGGDVEVSVHTMTVVDDLQVTGDLGFRSAREAQGLDLATVGGAVVSKTPLPPNLRLRALGLVGRFLVVLFLTVAALTAAYGWPGRMSAAVRQVGRRPIRRWVAGASVVFAPVALMAVTALMLGFAPATAALPLLAVLVPLILATIGVVFAVSLVAGAPVVGWLGGALFRRLDLYGSILVGSVIIGVVWYLPIVGWVVPIVVLPLGLGAWFATWGSQSEESSLPESESTSSTSR